MSESQERDVELRWAGKREEALPEPGTLCDVERVECSDGCGEAPQTSTDPDWANRLILGDNREVIAALLAEFEGQIDLIYIDPPFATGRASFKTRLQIGPESAAPPIDQPLYSDAWGRGKSAYLQMIYSRLELMRRLLKPDGCLYVHCDWRTSAHLRLILDELFGEENFVNEIIWGYSRGGKGRDRFGRKHDTIYFYAKGPGYTFHGKDPQVAVRRRPNSHMRVQVDADGRAIQEKTDRKTGKVYRYPADEGKTPEDYWTDIEGLNRQAAERVTYATQKPEALLRRILAASSDPGDLVADFFCGSGTTLAAAEALGRRWIGVDLEPFAVHTTRKRLTAPGASPPHPFRIQRLEKNLTPRPPSLPEKGEQRSPGREILGPDSPLPSLGRGAGGGRSGGRCAVSIERRDGQAFVRLANGEQSAGGPGGIPFPAWIDYWAVDFRYDGGLFVTRRQASRGPHGMPLEMALEATPLDGCLAVKVVDCLGNEAVVEVV